MSCNCNSNNGKTYINSILPLPKAVASATSTTYVFDLTHYLCGNRKLCINAAYPLSAVLNYQVQSIEPVGNGAYDCTILCTGQCTYMPYKCGCNSCNPCNNCNPCNICPQTDYIFCQFNIPLTSETVPTLTAGIAVCDPANVSDCCNTTNAVSISSSLLVSQRGGVPVASSSSNSKNASN